MTDALDNCIDEVRVSAMRLGYVRGLDRALRILALHGLAVHPTSTAILRAMITVTDADVLEPLATTGRPTTPAVKPFSVIEGGAS